MKTITLVFSGKITRTILFLFLAFSLIECRGPRGFDGQDGLNGDVYSYSAIYDVLANEWTGDVDGYHRSLDVPEINDDIYNNGAVLVYRLFEQAPKSFNMLPYTFVDNALSIYMDYDVYIGEVDLLYKEVFEGSNDTYAPEANMAFKVVIIEGIPLATVKSMVDVNDYNAVVKTFKLNNINEKYIKAF